MRIPGSVSRDVADAIRSVWGPLERYAHPAIVDLASRRMAHASAAEDAADLVTLGQVEALIAAIEHPESGGSASVSVRVGAFTNRGSASPAGKVFFASDRDYVGWVSTGSAWIYVAGIQSGTLDPDEKPTLTTNDVGYLFHSTDFNRLYRWSGTAWADAPGQPARYAVHWFTVAPDPITGWALLDGSTVDVSTKIGGVTEGVVLSDMVTANRFPRASGTAGGTGGAETVDPPSTASGNNSASQEVQSGTGVTVAAHTHTHNTDLAALDILPPYLDLLPYVRL